MPTNRLDIGAAILGKSDAAGHRNRVRFDRLGLAAVNVVSSPGSGKTTLLERTLAALVPDFPCAVVVGDLATDNDGRRLSAHCDRVYQVQTGDACHLDADMVAGAVDRLDMSGVRLLIIENVGNLVCPSSYFLGEHARVVLLSITEGEDKPLKYPTMFKSADAVVVTKTDLAAALECDVTDYVDTISRVAPQAEVLAVSARSGAGMYAWLQFLKDLTHGYPVKDDPAR